MSLGYLDDARNPTSVSISGLWKDDWTWRQKDITENGRKKNLPTRGRGRKAIYETNLGLEDKTMGEGTSCYDPAAGCSVGHGVGRLHELPRSTGGRDHGIMVGTSHQ
jgi:hypothetical protein